MNKMTDALILLMREDFEQEYDQVIRQMPKPPSEATPDQIIRHCGEIFHRLAFLKGLSAGVEASQVYPK